MRRKTKVILGLGILLLLSTIVDLVTAINNPVFKIAEANPLYVFTNSITLVAMANLFVMGWIIWNVQKSINIITFMCYVAFTLLLIYGHAFGAHTNIESHQSYDANPDKVKKELENTSSKDKYSKYFLLVGILILVPLIVIVVSAGLTYYVAPDLMSKRERRLENLRKNIKKLNKLNNKIDR